MQDRVMQPHPLLHTSLLAIEELQICLHPYYHTILTWCFCFMGDEVLHPIIVAPSRNREGAITYLDPLGLVLWKEFWLFVRYN